MCCHHSQHGSRPHLNRHVLDPSARVLLLVDLYKVSPWIQSIQLIRAGRQPHGVSGTHRDLQPVRPTMPRRRKRASAAPPCESQGTSGSGHTGREVGRGTGHLTHGSVGRASATSTPSASVRTSVAGGAPAATSARTGHVPEWRRGAPLSAASSRRKQSLQQRTSAWSPFGCLAAGRATPARPVRGGTTWCRG